MAAARSLLRGLPLFFRASPKTPLRVLGIVALDTLHRLRHKAPLSSETVRDLARVLDLEGCTNAACDGKRWRAAEYHAIRRQLAQAGRGPCVQDYLDRLRELEHGRPAIGGDDHRFHEVRAYREAVARLSLATAAAMALHRNDLDEALRATEHDQDIATLFRILMQCQILDDVLDYEEDVAAGLPSFLTACRSLPRALALTAEAARRYATRSPAAPGHAVFPLRVARAVLSPVTMVVVWAATTGAPSPAPTSGAALERR